MAKLGLFLSVKYTQEVPWFVTLSLGWAVRSSESWPQAPTSAFDGQAYR